jgi:hypothetical protein
MAIRRSATTATGAENATSASGNSHSGRAHNCRSSSASAAPIGGGAIGASPSRTASAHSTSSARTHESERDERACLPRRESEPLGDVSIRGGEQHQAVEPAVKEDTEQPPDLPVDAAHRAQCRAHPGIERERIERLAVRGKPVDVLGDRVSHGAPVELGEDGAGLVGIGRRRARRVGRRPCLAARSPRGEPLGRDRLGRLALRQVGSGHAACKLHDMLPQEAHAPRTAETEARLVVLILVRRCADRGRERAHGPTLGASEPSSLVLGRGDGGEQAHLRPAHEAVDERRFQAPEAFQASADRREALHLARGEAEPLAGVIAEPAEAEVVMGATAEERMREPAEHDPAARLLRGESAKPAVENECGVVGVEPAAVGLGRDEQLLRDVHRRRRLGEYRPVVKYAF